jgi:hypothetical protein
MFRKHEETIFLLSLFLLINSISPDKRPLAVMATSPANNAPEVNVNASLSVIFNEAIDAASLTNITFIGC